MTTPRLAIYPPGRQAPASAAIDRFIENLPLRPYCSEDPRRFGVYPRQRDRAIERAYIQPNAPWKTVYLALDIDRQGAAFVVEDAGLPSPTFTVINQQTAHAHLLYELSDPVYPGRSNKADWLLSAVRGGFTRMLGADSGYRGPLVQNPLNCRWRKFVTENRYGLRDLAAELPAELLQPQRMPSAPQLDTASRRNVHLFETVRRLAYRVVKLVRGREEFQQLVLRLCRCGNTHTPPLPDSEVRTVARSITKWVWRHRDSIGSRSRRHRGVLGLEPIGFKQGEMRQGAIKVYQRAGATYSRARRTLTINAAIKSALDQLNREETKVTVAAIARWAQVSRNSVYRYLRESRSEGHPEGLFSDVHQNEHFQDDTADALIGVCNPEASRFAADDAENRAAA